jgi:GNAT superfamily N-acetyltransferase
VAYGGVLPERTVTGLTPEALLPAWQQAISNPGGPAHATFVATYADLVVGFADAGPSPDPDAGPADGLLAVLAVDLAHQRAGHGSRLLAAVADHLREHGMATLSAWVPEFDLARGALLRAAGLQPDGAQRRYRGAGDAEVVELRLTARLTDEARPGGTA